MKPLLLIVLLTVAIAACGTSSASSSSSSAAPTTKSGSTAASGRACGAVPQSKISAVAGFGILTSQETDVTGGTSPADICEYVGLGGQALSVDRFGSGVSFDDMAKVQFGSATPQAVSGVGDRAEFVFKTTGGNPDAELLAQKGQKLVLVIYIAPNLTGKDGMQTDSQVANLELAA